MEHPRRKSLAGLIIGLAASALVFSLTWIDPTEKGGLFEGIELKTLDFRFRRTARAEEASRDIVIVYLDDRTLSAMEQKGLGWPIERMMYGAVLTWLREAGARLVFFDFEFPARSSFDRYVSAPWDDPQLVTPTVETGIAIHSLRFLDRLKSDDDPAGESASLVRFAVPVEGAELLPDVPDREGAIRPFPELLDASPVLGAVNPEQDPDGTLRRIPLLNRFADRYYPSAALRIAMAIEGVGKLAVEPGPTLRIGSKRVPVDPAGRMLLWWHGGGGTYSNDSFVRLLNAATKSEEPGAEKALPEDFRGKTVFLGSNAAALFDLKATPTSETYPGVEAQATALDNILNGPHLVRAAGKARWASAAVLAILVAWVALTIENAWWTLAAFAASLAAYAAIAWLGFRHATLWLDVASPTAATLASGFFALTYKYFTEGKKKNQIRAAFQRYMSPEWVREVIAHPEKLKLGGERRILTVIFSDLSGFTSISENMQPEQLVALLNRYLTHQTRIIIRNGGTLDKYEGDLIMAFWGAPVAQEDHALRACRTALECRAALDRLAAELVAQGYPLLSSRTGINSGPMVVGNMGAEERFNYTVMGDAVNLGSRLESANKAYGTHIMISEMTLELVGEAFVVRELDLLRVKGKAKPVRVYELMAEAGRLPAPRERLRERYNEGIARYREARFAEAKAAFEEALRIAPEDGPSRTYIDRCVAFIEEPPKPGWDGVFEMKTK